MKKNLSKLKLLFLFAILSCGLPADNSLDQIVDLYGGKFHLENGVKVSTAEGKENFIKVVSENNKLVADGWLLPEAMSNNCAVLFTSLNPKNVKENDFLEVEISNGEPSSFKYKKHDLDELGKEYRSVEKILFTLINDLKTNEINKVKGMIEKTPSLSEKDLTSFLYAFKSTIPSNYKETKLIGYRKENAPEQLFIVDGVLIAQDETQKMVNATLVSIGNDLKFREINF